MARLVLLLAIASASNVRGTQTHLLTDKMVRKLNFGSASDGPQSAAELKERLSTVMKSDQVQSMMKDPQLKDGMWGLLHDPQAVGQMTNDPQLASSLQEALEKDPHFLDDLIPGHEKKSLYSEGFAQSEHEDDSSNLFHQNSLHLPTPGFSDHKSAGTSLEDIEGATIDQIHAEFARLTRDDQEHARRLHDSSELRNNLKKELTSLVEGIADDNGRLNRRIKVDSTGSASLLSSTGKDLADGDQDSGVDEFADETSALSIQEIGASIAQATKKMREQISELRKRDKVEMSAMKKNAKSRRKLKDNLQKRIKEQKEELLRASKEEDNTFKIFGDE